MTSVTDTRESETCLTGMAMGMKEGPAQDISDFAGKFLGTLYQDGAVVPDTLRVSARKTGAAAD